MGGVFYFVIKLGMCIYCKRLFISIANLSRMESNFLNRYPCMPSWSGVFKFGTFLSCFESIEVYFYLRSFLSIRLFSYILSVPIFCSNIILFPCHPVIGIFFVHFPLLVGRIFFVVLKYPILSILFYPVSTSFLVFSLSQVTSGSFPRVVLFVLLVLLFSFSSQHISVFSFVLSFLLVVVDFLSTFPIVFPIQVLNFCSLS